MKHTFHILFLLLGFLLPLQGDQAGLTDPEWTSGTLENGIRYFIRPNAKPEDRLELRLVVNAGSVLEADDQQGLAHFLEHAAFNGTTHFEKNEMVKFLESLGVGFGPDLNAYTSFDETVYKLKVPTEDPEVVDKAYLILSDWASKITASDEALEAERGVVIEEWRGRRGARARVRDKQFPVLFPGSRYAERLPIGKLDVLQTFEFERLRDYYRDWYRPELISVVAVGNLEVDETRQHIETYFQGIPPSKGAPERTEYVHPPHEETMVGTFSDPELTGAEVAVFWKMPPDPTLNPDDYRQDIKAGLIVSMLNQRLEELTQQADAPFLGAGVYRGSYTRGGDVFLGQAGVKNEEGAFVKASRALVREIERARLHGFTDSELARAKISRLRQVEQAYNERDTRESASLAAEMVDHALIGTYVPGMEKELELHRELLPEVGTKELQKMLRSWISDENRVIMAEGPSSDGETNLPEEDELLAVFEQVAGQEITPYEETLIDQPLVADPPEAGEVIRRTERPELGLTIWELSNGVRVVLKPTDFKQDEILVSGWQFGGMSQAGLDDELLHARQAVAVASATGMGAFSSVDLRKKLSGTLVSLAPYISRDTQGFQGSAPPQDLETLLQLVYLRSTTVREDTEAFEAYRERLAESVRNRLANPKEKFSDLVRQTLSNYHPRLQPTTLEDVERLDMKEALSFFQDRFTNARGMTFYLTGAIQPEDIEASVTRWLGGLPASETIEQADYFDPGLPMYRIRRTMSKGLEPVSEVRMVWSSRDFEWSYDQRHAVNSMIGALRIRLREVLREEKGGTYHVSTWPQFQHRPEPELQIIIAFGCAPDRVESLIAAARGVIQDVRDAALDEEYVVTVQQTQRRSREVGLKQNGFWNSVLPFYDRHGEDPEVINRFETYVSGLTAEKIRSTAERVFDTPHQSVFVLLPEEMPEEEEGTSPEE